MSRKDLTSNWEGHEPATSAALLDVITDATSGSARLSRSDRVLFTACEFWAAARNSALLSQLSENALSQLRAAEIAFTAIGLTKAANILHRARIELTELDTPLPLRLVVEKMEKALAGSDEQVDQKIAEFANKLARDRLKTS